MPTILLQEIRDLLTAFLTAINTKIEQALAALSSISETASNIKNNTDDIKEDTDSLVSTTQSIDGKLDVLSSLSDKLDVLEDIKDNTGVVLTPINNIKIDADSIKADAAIIASNTTVVKNGISSIATAAGQAAAFDEDTATNTQNIYDKIVTIASDTTQQRADLSQIITILNDINSKL